MKRVALHNLGCKVNGYEMDVMQQKLKENGYEIVQFDERADIYIINTCTVTNIAAQKSRQLLHRAKSLNKEAVVVAAGCYAQLGEQTLYADGAVDLIIGNNRKNDIVNILDEYFAARENNRETPPDKTLGRSTLTDIGHVSEYEEMQLRETRENTRAYVKIQDGCNQFCSYCVIPYVRGRARSRGEEDIVTEVSEIAKRGYKEIVLTGIHISSYGVDRGESELLRLLERLSGIQGVQRIRLGSLEPQIITKGFVKGISSLDRLCPHFHISLQSGCDETLKRMNRHYTTGEYLEKVEMLREYYDRPALTTDVIVGFPDETEEEFLCTQAFLKKAGFYETHVFKYSRRQGTRAAAMKNQLSDAVKRKRSEKLINLSKEMSFQYRQSMRGRMAEVLFEDSKVIDGRRYQLGHTKEYIKAAKETRENLNNTIETGELTEFLREDIMLFS